MQVQVDNIILVLIRAEEFESILDNKFSAQGEGLGQRVRYVEHSLAPELTEKLWWIVGIRNEAAHKPSTFQLYNPEKFIRTCDEAKAMLDTMAVPNSSFSGLASFKRKFKQRLSSSLDSSRANRKIPANQSYTSSISFLIYIGIIMALAVQFARANTWHLPLFKSYEDAFATSLFLTFCGVAHTAYIWQNGYVGFGLILSTIGGFAWKYKWVIPIVKTYEIPLYVGIFLILYGAFPQLLGIISVVAGSLLLTVELWLMFTKGLAAVHYGNLLASVILVGTSALMFRRQKKLSKTGVFISK